MLSARPTRRAALACLRLVGALSLVACFHDDGARVDPGTTTEPPASASDPASTALEPPLTSSVTSTGLADSTTAALTTSTSSTAATTGEPDLTTTGCLEQTWYPDPDGDGYGVDDGALLACAQPPGYAAVAGDCDPVAGDVSPGQPELCDGRDNDCDLGVDEYSPDNLACGGCRMFVWPAESRVFYLCSALTAWPAARTACQAYGAGTDLAVFHGADEQSAVVGQISAVPAEAAGAWWIGLGDAADEGLFVWVDGSGLDFSSWSAGEPNNLDEEDCVQYPAGQAGVWNDLTCATPLFYICEGPP
ncbi:MAG: hypothetical protein JNL82_12800 [Myxococcales bacterium]|nr:hypothetical protein [Myxococcales bacterium]